MKTCFALAVTLFIINKLTAQSAVFLTDFRYVIENNTVKFAWKTSAESQLDYFVLEKITETLTEVGTIKAYGTTANVNNYTYTDQSPTPNAVYRLRVVNKNGVIVNYSPYLRVNYSKVILRVVNGVLESNTVVPIIRVYNMVGQLVYSCYNYTTGYQVTEPVAIHYLHNNIINTKIVAK